jgi:alkanesulfonate monooxygenase SsuD/methylene tetrahydromethanopterin reductase-like flavin-dependent oxidoreductase (luciferase family)
VRFAVSIPQLDTSGFDGAGVQSYLARAEETGFESAWTIEQTLGPTPMIGPLPLLAYAAACTERLRLGVGVLVSSQHDPVHLAGWIAALDRLSHGRLDVGVSAGGGFRNFAAFGVDRDTFVSYFTEGLQLMKAAWSDEPSITFHGRFRELDDVAISPKPVQRPHPPIWFGASAPTSIARAVAHGNAFLGAGSSTTAKFAGHVQLVRRALADRGGDAARFPIAKRVYLAVDNDAQRARDHVNAGLHRMYGAMAGIEDVAVAGTADDVVVGLRAVEAAGAEMILLNPLGADVADDREQLERLLADVIPAWRDES